MTFYGSEPSRNERSSMGLVEIEALPCVFCFHHWFCYYAKVTFLFFPSLLSEVFDNRFHCLIILILLYNNIICVCINIYVCVSVCVYMPKDKKYIKKTPSTNEKGKISGSSNQPSKHSSLHQTSQPTNHTTRPPAGPRQPSNKQPFEPSNQTSNFPAYQSSHSTPTPLSHPTPCLLTQTPNLTASLSISKPTNHSTWPPAFQPIHPTIYPSNHLSFQPTSVCFCLLYWFSSKSIFRLLLLPSEKRKAMKNYKKKYT